MKNVTKAYEKIAELLDKMNVKYHIDNNVDDIYDDRCLSAIICAEDIGRGIFIASVWETIDIGESLCLGEEAVDMDQKDIDSLKTEEDLIKMLWDYGRFDLKKILESKKINSNEDNSNEDKKFFYKCSIRGRYYVSIDPQKIKEKDPLFKNVWILEQVNNDFIDMKNGKELYRKNEIGNEEALESYLEKKGVNITNLDSSTNNINFAGLYRVGYLSEYYEDTIDDFIKQGDKVPTPEEFIMNCYDKGMFYRVKLSAWFEDPEDPSDEEMEKFIDDLVDYFHLYKVLASKEESKYLKDGFDDWEYWEANDGEGPFADIEQAFDYVEPFNLRVKEDRNGSYYIIGRKQDLIKMMNKYYNSDQIDYIRSRRR